MSGPRRERLLALCAVRALVAATAVSVTLARTNFPAPGPEDAARPGEPGQAPDPRP